MVEHMKNLLCAIALGALVGCATSAKYDQKLQQYVGLSETEMVQRFGPPTSTYPMPDGGKVMTYSENMGAQSNTTYNSMTNSLDTSSGANACTTHFILNKEGIITSTRWTGNSCRAR